MLKYFWSTDTPATILKIGSLTTPCFMRRFALSREMKDTVYSKGLDFIEQGLDIIKVK